MYENVLEPVRLDTAEDDLLLETTKHSSEIIENKNILRRINHIYFLVCNSCLWCATYFVINDLESLSRLQLMLLVVIFAIHVIPS